MTWQLFHTDSRTGNTTLSTQSEHYDPHQYNLTQIASLVAWSITNPC
jgi:hypothetical protein